MAKTYKKREKERKRKKTRRRRRTGGVLTQQQAATKIQRTFRATDDCSICYDKLINKHITLSCGHKFHNKCFRQLKLTHTLCPLCRASAKQLQPSTNVDEIIDEYIHEVIDNLTFPKELAQIENINRFHKYCKLQIIQGDFPIPINQQVVNNIGDYTSKIRFYWKGLNDELKKMNNENKELDYSFKLLLSYKKLLSIYGIELSPDYNAQIQEIIDFFKGEDIIPTEKSLEPYIMAINSNYRKNNTTN